MRKYLECEGEVRFRSATIGGLIDCEGSKFINPTGYSLNLEGTKISGAILLRNNFESEGEVRLFSASVGVALECDKSKFTNTIGPAINAYPCKIGGAVLFLAMASWPMER